MRRSQFDDLVVVISCGGVVAVEVALMHDVQKRLVVLHFKTGPGECPVMPLASVVCQEIRVDASLISTVSFMDLR